MVSASEAGTLKGNNMSDYDFSDLGPKPEKEESEGKKLKFLALGSGISPINAWAPIVEPPVPNKQKLSNFFENLL